MKHFKKNLLVGAAISVLISACAAGALSIASHTHEASRAIQRIESAVVVAVRPVRMEPRAQRLNLAALFTAGIAGVVVQRTEPRAVQALQTGVGVEITYTTRGETFSVVQHDDGSGFAPGETVRVLAASAWGASVRVVKL